MNSQAVSQTVSQTLVVGGMHRSGTSLMAHYLSECGLDLGEEMLEVALNRSCQSYRGHHEDRAFLEFHKAVLDKQWLNAFPTHAFRLPIQVGRQDRQTALALVHSRANRSQWGWKDPRTTLFLDFWQQILDQATYLLLLRNPLSVVDSLLRRGNEAHINRHPVNGLKVWQVYNQLILQFWQQHRDRTLIYDIDQLLQDPEQIRSLLSARGFQLQSIPLSQVFLQPAFQTGYSAAVEHLQKQHPRQVETCMQLYQALKEIATIPLVHQAQ